MRIDVAFEDRVGIASEILSVMARRRLDVVAVEVEPPHLFIDVPGLAGPAFAELRGTLAKVEGVRAVQPVEMLPGARRRLHLDTLLDALVDPVLAVDGEGRVVVANAAAADALGLAGEAAVAGTALATLFDDPEIGAGLRAKGFREPPREATVRGTPFMLETRPIVEGEAVAGGVILLHAPRRIGERLNALQHAEAGGFEAILGDSPAIQALKARAARVAPVDAPLMVLGETGTGKELLALACHRASPRADKPFLALNCAALPESLAESELFGYASGAFSGARRDGKPGLLELADRGTVFLDEIGEMSLYLQAKLLRFLNDGSFRRVGGEREARVNVRIVSATHRDLPAMIARGEFREDLYYRLNVLGVEIPPLRDRGDDVLLLARHFAERAAAQARRPACRLTAAAEEALVANAWPGNVRQLENAVFRAVTLSEHAAIGPDDLELPVAPAKSASVSLPDPETWTEAVEGFERDLLKRLYPDHPSSRRLAARLGTSHTMIANKLRRFGLPER
ncbi:MAG: sigma 54-interacting transcriptional regulator [Amaricoccus sp.]